MLGRRSPAAGGAAATATASPTSSPAIATAAASGGGAAAAGPGTAAAAAVVRKRFRLRVAPAGAMILVDGREATLDGDGLLLEGPLGATRTVTLRRDGQEQEHVVVFAEHGMVPDRLTFVERPAGPPASGKRARAAGLARSREAGAPASGTASASASAPPTSPASPETQAATQSSKRSAGLSNSVDEFK
jgi:hypothetical protein